jgi:hypothetical protein
MYNEFSKQIFHGKKNKESVIFAHMFSTALVWLMYVQVTCLRQSTFLAKADIVSFTI